MPGDKKVVLPEPWGSRSAAGSNGLVKSNDFGPKTSVDAFSRRTPNRPHDIDTRQSTSSVPKSILQSQKSLGSAYQPNGPAKGCQPYQGRFPNYSANYGEARELTRGPRAVTPKNPHTKNGKIGFPFTEDRYNLEEFPVNYDRAKFYVIKSYSEDDVHKSVKYDVWSSTPKGNTKLDDAFRDAERTAGQTGSKCPVFLFFSVNGSGQFVGVAEMVGPVDYEKNLDFWQLDKWNGFFPVRWRIIKDVPNKRLWHIVLENSDNRPVTYTRDTQEVGLKQGLEMLDVFKSYSSKTSLLDDFSFYESREKLLKAKRAGKAVFRQDGYPGDGFPDAEGSLGSAVDATAAAMRNLALGSKNRVGKKSTS